MEAQHEFQYERARPKSRMRHGTCALVWVGRDLGWCACRCRRAFEADGGDTSTVTTNRLNDNVW